MVVDSPSGSSAGSSRNTKFSESSLVTPPLADYKNLPLKQEKPEELRRRPKALVDCYRVLTKVFGHAEYKGKQKEIVEVATLGADVLVIAPTGMGKSLCFQIPAVADEHGITIVISPLLALMKNQVSKLRGHDIHAVAFTSETSATEKQQIIRDLGSGHPTYRLLYITPEKLCSKEFMELLEMVYSHRELNRLVVDEAHCISEWGHDFRTEYRRLGSFRDRFPEVPIMGLTASATAHVQDDIAASLKMSKTHMFKVVHPFNRLNLYYEVHYLANPAPASLMANIHAYIAKLHQRRNRPSSGIIYCRTRATCDNLAAFLRGKGLSARPYHRGIKPATLDRTLDEWQIGGAGNGGIDVVVATIAFGCGIDKSDVRYVIHYDLPKSLEGYYQETGRAGRDGSPSKCILYYSREDAIKVRKLVGMSHKQRQAKAALAAMPAPTQRTVDSVGALIDFAETTSVCRHVSICRYFGEVIDETDTELMAQYCRGMCDSKICKYPDKAKRRKAMLSSEDFLSTQVPRLKREVRPENEDEDGYPISTDHRVPIDDRNSMATGGSLPRRYHRGNDDNDKPIGTDARQAPRSTGSTKTPMELKRSRMPLNDAENATKRARIGPPVLGSGLVSKRLRETSKAPFKTPFKSPFDSTTASVGRNVKPRQQEPVEIEEDSFGMSFGADENVTVVSDGEEAGMLKSTPVGNTRSSSPVDMSDKEVELEAPFSQKIPITMREEALISIRRALHKVFMHTDTAKWRHLRLDASDIDTRLRVLSATAKALEFVVHSHCSTAEGYEFRALAQVAAAKALRDDRVWREEDADGDELEDAREILPTLQRLSSAARKGKQKEV